MKKVEKVEVQYIRQSMALLLAVICLVVGFGLGIAYSRFDSDGKSTVRNAPAPPPQATSQAPAPDVKKMAVVKELKKQAVATPDNPQVWAELGHQYFDMNDFQNAIEAYKKHLELNPNNADVLTDLGVMYRRSGNSPEAIRCFDKAVAANPKHQQSRFNKGIVLMFDFNARDEALASWRDLLKVNPSATAPDGTPIKDLIAKYENAPTKQ